MGPNDLLVRENPWVPPYTDSTFRQWLGHWGLLGSPGHGIQCFLFLVISIGVGLHALES